MDDIRVNARCTHCGEPVSVIFLQTQTELGEEISVAKQYQEVVYITVEPCKQCLSVVRAEGFDDGVKGN
jgi:hypothetical protein